MDVSTIKKIGIVGCGVMGPSIAELFAIFGASSEYEIVIYDISPSQIEKAKTRMDIDFAKVSSTGLFNTSDLEVARNRIQLENDINSLADSNLIIEAVPEKLELKLEVFNQLDKLTPPSTILATNSSGLSITQIANATNRPLMCIGTHFMNPPLLMPLVEVVKGKQTSDQTVQTIVELLTNVNKRPVLVKKDIPGYVHNRLQAALFREVMYLLDEGVMEVQDLETTVKYGLGLRLPVMKVFEMVDLMGLDTIQNVLNYLYPTLNCSTSPPSFLKQMIQAGELGTKSGKGFHDYTKSDIQESMQQKEAATFQLLLMMQQYD
ncbi:MAG: 3-hydroxyacyl-CoA dehydrogenase family protein [Candidatus Heimdallarchaeota archaeon]|nr:MAG: 3-hydroxyacyl-CoA dehydrogenase family protein [Candidatus Heimdallarchaeota archaeon]